MKDILVLHYHSGRPDGTLTSMIDLYLNLSERLPNVRFRVIAKNAIGQVIKLFLDNMNFGLDENVITMDTKFKADTIIASTKLLADIGHYQKDLGINVDCNKMILLDSLDLMKSKYDTIVDLHPFVPCKDVTLLTNPSNFDASKFKHYEYYHKLSEKRIGDMRLPEVFIYTRVNKFHIRIADNIYFENIGKFIWECLYNNHKVLYYSEGMQIKDGLYYYLKLFGVDASKDHVPLDISREEVVDKLFMKDNDLILELLGE